MLLTILLIIAIILVLILCTFFVFPWLVGAPYDISRKTALKNIIKSTNPKSGDKIAELGSGDGRVCISLAKQNPKIQIHGFEINPFLVWISRRKIRKLSLQNQIKIHWRNFWKVDLSKYNKIIFFQFRSITKRLENKFNRELKSGTKIISHNWKLPNYKIEKQLGEQQLSQGIVYLYER